MPDEKPIVEEFPGNSQSSKKEEVQEEPKAISRKVAAGRRVERKKTFFNDIFKGTLTAIGSYVLFDIVIPAGKRTLSDVVNNALDIFLYGEPNSRRHDRDRDRGRPVVSYTSYSDRDRGRDRDFRDRDRDRDRLYGRYIFHSDDVLLDTREEADDVVRGLYEMFDNYNSVSVSDFLELVGLPYEHTDLNYGWTGNLRDAQVRRTREGYVIELPTARPLPR